MGMSVLNMPFYSMLFVAVVYPELVSRGVSKSRKFKWLVKVGACKDVNPLIKKKTCPGGGGFRATRKPPPPGYATVWYGYVYFESAHLFMQVISRSVHYNSLSNIIY